ncbi:hypothetical protein CC80DRAFT_497397 [Byssothecium circinans]|uniref:C2H2-type domain-containing protein n=1 Tax=Byssothecium circinans TaxID=147558 RepID=A0A6A5TCP6_9PLEO|nr:hypothetical protein CC80DRAFT_497397 [Byssothecium circinans]
MFGTGVSNDPTSSQHTPGYNTYGYNALQSLSTPNQYGANLDGLGPWTSTAPFPEEAQQTNLNLLNGPSYADNIYLDAFGGSDPLPEFEAWPQLDPGFVDGSAFLANGPNGLNLDAFGDSVTLTASETRPQIDHGLVGLALLNNSQPGAGVGLRAWVPPAAPPQGGAAFSHEGSALVADGRRMRQSSKKATNRRHSKAKKITCTQPGCPVTFGRPHEFRRHFRTVHERKKSSRCMFCEYEYPRLDKVRFHMEKMHGFKVEKVGKDAPEFEVDE